MVELVESEALPSCPSIERVWLDRNQLGRTWPGQNEKARRIGLMDAIFEDILNAMNEEAEWLAFVQNKEKSIGKGPTVLVKQLKERKELCAYAQLIIDAFQQQRLDADIAKHSHPDRHFLASTAAKHRVPKNFSKGNPTQAGKVGVKGKGHGTTSVNGWGGGNTGCTG